MTARPVVGSTLPIDMFRSETAATGKPPPTPGGVGVVLRLFGSFDGNGIHDLPLSLERTTPPLPAT